MVILARPLRARLVNLASTGVVAGVHGLCLLAPFVSLSWRVVALGAVSYFLQTLGVMAGYHRYFSHHAFKTSRAFQFILAWLGCAAMQNGPLWWASSHRRHHRFSDRPGDPHSPVLNGFWQAHLGWVLSGDNDHPDLGNVREFCSFRELRLLDRFKWLPTLVTGVVSGFAFGAPGLVWGLGIATTLAFHAPLFVNSACHTWGTRRFDTRDASRNNVVLGALALGEGWHNNHHHDPSSARHGLEWWEIDITYYAIWTLSRFGVVWDVRNPRPPPNRGSPRAADDARRPAHVAQHGHCPGCEAGSDCGKLGGKDAEHPAIRANPKPIIKTCTAPDSQRSCGGGGK